MSGKPCVPHAFVSPVVCLHSSLRQIFLWFIPVGAVSSWHGYRSFGRNNTVLVGAPRNSNISPIFLRNQPFMNRTAGSLVLSKSATDVVDAWDREHPQPARLSRVSSTVALDCDRGDLAPEPAAERGSLTPFVVLQSEAFYLIPCFDTQETSGK